MKNENLVDVTSSMAAMISEGIVSAIDAHGSRVPDDARPAVLMNAVAMVVASYFNGRLDEFFEVLLSLEGWDDDEVVKDLDS